MLYDQAQLAVAYSYAFQATQDSKFEAIVEDILTYVDRDLSHPLGGFFRYKSYVTQWARKFKKVQVKKTREFK